MVSECACGKEFILAADPAAIAVKGAFTLSLRQCYAVRAR